MIELASLCGTAAAAALSTPDPARKSCERGWALGTMLQREGRGLYFEYSGHNFLNLPPTSFPLFFIPFLNYDRSSNLRTFRVPLLSVL